METRQKIEFTDLPLAVYREIAAHLQQVEGVEVGLIPQSSESFDYNQSQIAGLWIEHTPKSVPQSRQRVEQILAYYRSRYGVRST
ncbi:hypothetical protein G7B40_022155 [Aetokthonos hydrillicola Thurmond2011]|jgi:hypothetical protein|uniref:Uncharacterized protein n=1 Tax=Aetokthonos hydrillicola Thurmond2011 TaxID=2712845 RepID=A0AAP5I946_9CYAN|nr:hypothetical protein [Aetokthonos hydrillicola]MBO3460810.1 hypothetical protein [Aetokthonos hydrillicola CCALA 1050]MBW4588273.1 hypothetical protein [Aetokthonos hydrillicola CCALA 1050]MDR9897247.1 hypothetical protein [Aetokthonos hydrillicola Thurmond2011]